MAANLEDQLIDKVRAPPPNKQQEALRLLDTLASGTNYLRHSNEVDEYLARREQRAEEVQQRIESQQGDLSEIRARMLTQGRA